MSAPRERKRPRRSRWEPVDERVKERRELQARLDRITSTIATNAIPVDELCRSPSPEPRYDARGKRVNTRYDRALDKLEMERFKLCARLGQLDPTFRPPHGMRALKFSDKLFIPKEKEGTLNFIGRILGPRGNTQKRLEKDYNCKVAIRGKGSVKDGRARGPSQPEDSEQLHVIITAEGMDAKDRIAQCKIKIMDILQPRPDDANDHKQAQLRELAQLNGTLRDQDRDFRSPAARGAFDRASGRIACAICGESSHPTPDCPKKGPKPPDDANLDADYVAFMAELNGVDPTSPKPPSQPNSDAPTAPHDRRHPTQRPTPPWLLPGAFATRPAPPPPPADLRPAPPGHPPMPHDPYAPPYVHHPAPPPYANPPPYGAPPYRPVRSPPAYGQGRGAPHQYPPRMYMANDPHAAPPDQRYGADNYPPPPPPPAIHKGPDLPPPPPPPPARDFPPPPPPG
ncbi:splicing factor SF1, predicted [Chondrus crispus]|uniref:Splicing factor SF1, predicted n=1 Tax=Chondrus crispus TaxID=2769 RepID=R7QC89_CHOCR|nr:splicing factor SF1, predicted [Chondrus crispus]CDF35403.1 splicing factor SF1, predicted [Chondrus crispus]|eukprot:XP_005715222.1 splicing factor SF1, predicted [Chondrus crispus]